MAHTDEDGTIHAEGNAHGARMIPPSCRRKVIPGSRVTRASFRCRRRRFSRGINRVLTALTLLLLAVVYLTRHRGAEYHYHTQCGDAMDRVMLTMLGWERAPPEWRWLTFQFSREDFYSSHAALAHAAERHGYSSDAIRLRVVLMAMLVEKRNEAEEWAGKITAEQARRWSERALSGGVSVQFLGEIFKRARVDALRYPDSNESAGLLYVVLDEPGIATAARNTFRREFLRTCTWLALCATGLVFLVPLLKRLRRPDARPRQEGARLVKRWTPFKVWSVWLRAEWCFLFSGLALLALTGVGWWLWESQSVSVLSRVLEPLLRWCTNLRNSSFGPLFYVVLSTGAVFLMVRWLTPGFHGTLRLFGIRRCPLTGKAFLRTVLAGLSLVILLYIAFGFLSQWLGTEDWRDAWAHGWEPMWQQILFGCFVAPFAEEFIFRGFLFTGFSTAWKPFAAAAVSSLLFALMHGYSLEGLTMIWCFGMLMCTLYRSAGTLLVPMAVHSLTNLLILL